MCGRYALYGPQSRYREHFGTVDEFDLAPRFNIAPSRTLPVVSQSGQGGRRFLLARWGLIPSWSKDPTDLKHPINAKAETAAIKPMFCRSPAGWHRSARRSPRDRDGRCGSIRGGQTGVRRTASLFPRAPAESRHDHLRRTANEDTADLGQLPSTLGDR